MSATRLLRQQWLSTKFTQPLKRWNSTAAGIQASALKINKADTLKPLVPNQELVFGQTFTDHMVTIEWNADKGWESPEIIPHGKLCLDPSATVFHYAAECFEGMKAYKDKDGKIRLFRPDMNMARMNRSAHRIALPNFEGEEFLKVISEYLKLDQRWIPNERGYSLYLRPTMIGTQATLGVTAPNKALLFVIGSPVGPYYKTGFAAVSLKATTEYVRAWPRGTGDSKIGGNYAVGLLPQLLAAKKGFQQNLWLFGDDHQLTEVGAMNLFILWKNAQGETELVTPPLDGAILPGVTRDSILSLAREWGEFKVSERKLTMPELRDAVKENRVKEVFGAGTACIVSPVKMIEYQGEELNIPLDPNDSTSQAGPITKRINKAIMISNMVKLSILGPFLSTSWCIETNG